MDRFGTPHLVEVVIMDGSEAWRAVDAGDTAPGLLDVGPITESQSCNITNKKKYSPPTRKTYFDKKKKKRTPFISNDESTGTYICLKLDLYMSHVKITCATADSFCSLFPYPHNPRSHTCVYVTHKRNNVSRSFEILQVIHDTRNSNGQWPRCDVTKCSVPCGDQGHTK
jgi:hypothetical protein